MMLPDLQNGPAEQSATAATMRDLQKMVAQYRTKTKAIEPEKDFG